MNSSLEVLFTPAEFLALKDRDLGRTVCVVFDVLRATSSIMTALQNGAEAVIPVEEIAEAVAIRRSQPDVLLCGERHGVRIRGDQTGGVDFDLGNSPREFTAEAVRGRRIVSTTTNGTRALRACARAKTILIGSFLGLEALANWLVKSRPRNLLLVCAGTFEQAAYEDLLGAGALCELVWSLFEAGDIVDSAAMARNIYRQHADDLLGAMQFATNGRRLLARPALREDVPFCLQRDTLDFVAQLTPGGEVRKLGKSSER